MSLRPVTLGIHSHHCSLSKVARSRRWRRLLRVLGRKRWDEQQSPQQKKTWCDMMWTLNFDFRPIINDSLNKPPFVPWSCMIMPWMVRNPFTMRLLVVSAVCEVIWWNSWICRWLAWMNSKGMCWSSRLLKATRKRGLRWGSRETTFLLFLDQFCPWNLAWT